jgi:LacI family transcriptional regulator
MTLASLSIFEFRLSICDILGIFHSSMPNTKHQVSPIDPSSPHASHRHIRRKVLLLLGYYNVSLHGGIIRYAGEAGWALDDGYMRSGMPPVWWSGDGILGLITSPKDVRAWEKFSPDLPMVDLSKGWIADSMPAADRATGLGRTRVFYDNAKIARMAAGHFLQRGFKHIAYFNIGNYWHEMERIPVVRARVEEAGACFHQIEYFQHFSRASKTPLQERVTAQKWLTETIAALPKPLGIILTSDDWATCILQACDDANLTVPDEVAVLGCDNDPMICTCTPVPLSSIDLNWDGVGYEAARLLDRMMDGEAPPEKPVLVPPMGVVPRMSTNILAVPDPRIAGALRYIWEHFPEPLSSDQVAAGAGLNRRTLERGFREHLGRSVLYEISRVRIERAKTMLAESNLKAHQIADQCGFSGIVAFSKVFLRLTGMRPSDFRKSCRTAKRKPDST